MTVRTAPQVPWRTVLPLAALLALADEFWVVALRAAVGAVERTSDPATSWLRESVELWPWYVAAVVAALGVAHRRWGTRAGGARLALATVAVVAAAATAAGTVVLVVSTWYDHQLQVQALAHAAGAHVSCAAACLAEREAASTVVLLRAALVGVVLLLITNLVVVAWAAALRGRPIPAATYRPAVGGRDDRVLLLAVALVGSGLVHAAVVPDHLAGWRAAGLFLALVACVQLGAAAWVWRRPGRGVLLLVAAGSAGVVALWAASRAVGVPFGPEAGEPEAVGLADLAAGALELVALATCLVLVRGHASGRRPLPPHRRGVVLAGVVTVTVLGVAGSGLPGVALVPGGGTHALQIGSVADVTAP